jgi:hypothetical protein
MDTCSARFLLLLVIAGLECGGVSTASWRADTACTVHIVVDTVRLIRRTLSFRDVFIRSRIPHSAGHSCARIYVRGRVGKCGLHSEDRIGRHGHSCLIVVKQRCSTTVDMMHWAWWTRGYALDKRGQAWWWLVC